MPWHTSPKVMEVRDRHRGFDVLVETLDGWRRHLSGRNASLLSFFGFLTIFPLLLAATTILGFVLQDNEELQQEIIDGALDNVPVLGAQLADDPTALTGNALALVIGLGAALWSSTKAFVALQGALDDVWEVPVDDRSKPAVQRGKALVGIFVLGTAQVVGVVLAGIVNETDLPGFADLLIVAGQAALNVVVVGVMYTFMPSRPVRWADAWPGALIAGLVVTLLQHFGTLIVQRITDNASETYGQFALVLGLVTWIGLLAITTLMCAEFDAARVRVGDGSGVRRGDEFDLPIDAGQRAGSGAN